MASALLAAAMLIRVLFMARNLPGLGMAVRVTDRVAGYKGDA
jgi:hypothetical protein